MHQRVKIGAALGALAFNLAFPTAAAATTTVAQWNMDDATNDTMVDSSGNGNDGTTYNVVSSPDGYVFDGTTSMVVVPDSATLNPGTADFSYTVQVQTSVIPPVGLDYDLLRKGLSSTSGGEFKVEIVRGQGQARASCVIKDSRGRQGAIRGNTNLADGQLHTITCKKTANSVTLLVDTLRPRIKSVSLQSVSNSAELMVGAKASTGSGGDNDFYNGTMRSATITVEP